NLLRPTSHFKGREGLEIKQSINMPKSIMGDEHRGGWSILSETIGQIHGVAGRSEFRGLTERTHDREAGVDADAHLEGSGSAILKFSDSSLHRQTGADRSCGIIFARLPGPEDSHHCIAD